MKKMLSLFLALVFVVGICVSAPMSVTANAASVDDLKFELNSDGKSYSVSAKSSNIEGELIIPSTYNGLPVTTVAEEGFMFCSSLTSVSIPDSIEVIEDYGFYGCNSIDSLKLPKNLKRIGRSAFYGWHKLPSVTIPASVEFIAGAVFSSSYELTEIKVESGNEFYTSVEGILYNIDMTELLDYPVAKGGSTYTLPTTVTKIAGWCFSNNRYLTSIELNDNIKTIEDGTFAYCRTLKILEFGNNVTKIGVNSFRDCDKIVSLEFPNSIEMIDSFAFFDCGGLINVEIPEKVTVIKDYVFASCTSLESVTIPLSVVSIESMAFGNITSLKNVKYKGTETQWKAISIDETNNDSLLKANIEFLPGSDSHVHSFTSEITEYPTCTRTGVKTFTCSCGNKYTETIEALGHKWNDGTVIKQPTCTVQGEKSYFCKDCYTTKTELVPATGHKPTLVGAKLATFEADGHTGSEVCTVCNQTINAGSVIPKLTFTTPEVAIKNTAKGIEATWNAVENAQSYIVYRRVYNASTKKWSGWSKIKIGYTGTSYVDDTVTLGTQYRYTVRAVNGDVMSKYESTATLKYNVTPTVKISNVATGVKVTWSTAVNATGYVVYRSQYSNGKWSGWKNMGTAKANKITWTDKNVKSGVQYKYTVRACYNKIKSSYKDSNVTIFLTQPTVKFSNASTGIKVSWSKVSGATGYTVYRSQYTNGKWSGWKNMGTAKSTKSSWTDKKVESGATYKYTVRAVSGKYKSSYTDTKGLLYLAQPTVTVKAVSNGINVAWSQCDGATGYTVYRSEYNTKTKKWSSWKSMGTAKADKSNWTDKKATKGVKYKYTVRAVNADTGSKSTYVASKEIKR